MNEVVCNKCDGEGKVVYETGTSKVKVVCDYCNGTGKIKTICRTEFPFKIKR